MNLSLIALATTLFFTTSNLIQAHDHSRPVEVGGLIISNIWARATPRTAKTGAAFLTIKNKSKTEDTLIGVSSGVAKKTEIHKSSIENSIMKMRHIGKVSVPAGGLAELKPDSFHIMFMGLYAPIKHGDLFPLTLIFKTAGTVKVMVRAYKQRRKVL
jgi:copper(I)-binding protein